MIDLTEWPTVQAGHRIVQVPLPRMGELGYHVCHAASATECAECIARRDAEDARLKAQMMLDRPSGLSHAPRKKPLQFEWVPSYD